MTKTPLQMASILGLWALVSCSTGRWEILAEHTPPAFNPGAGFSGSIAALLIQPDGKILAGGNFTNYNGESISGLARLNPDGSLDKSFSTGTGFDNTVSALALQGDGKIIACGYFTSFNGTRCNRIARLFPDGSLDAAFATGQGFNALTTVILLLPNGSLLIGGDFSNYDGRDAFRLARLFSDGRFDSAFRPGSGFDQQVRGLCLGGSNTIVAVGMFTAFDGAPAPRLVRLLANGGRDTNFLVGSGFNSNVNDIAAVADGKLMVVGAFTNYNSNACHLVIRLNSDGRVDKTFDSGTGSDSTVMYASGFLNLPDGAVILCGLFSRFNGKNAGNIVKMGPAGGVDATFAPGIGFDNIVHPLALQSDGRIVAGGSFSRFDGVSRRSIARLNPRGTLDQ